MLRGAWVGLCRAGAAAPRRVGVGWPQVPSQGALSEPDETIRPSSQLPPPLTAGLWELPSWQGHLWHHGCQSIK